MFGGFIGGLFTAWILSLFYVDKMLIEVAQPIIKNIELTNSHYYIFFGVLGMIKETILCTIKYFFAK